MKALKQIGIPLMLITLFLSVSKCSSAQNLERESPIAIKDAYYQSWVAGAKGGGSGINVFIKVEDTLVKLDSIYFRNKSAALEIKPHDKFFYAGRFSTPANQMIDRVMHLDPKKEFGNTLPVISKPIPFDLKENECVISFRDGKRTKYFKLQNLRKEEAIPFPSAPIRKQ